MKIVWLDLNSSYAHSSLALPAIHAQLSDDNSIEWDIVSATVNENPGMIAGEIYRRRPDIIAATCWLFNHEMLLHVLSRAKALLPDCCITLGGPEFFRRKPEFSESQSFRRLCFQRRRRRGCCPVAEVLEHSCRVEKYCRFMLF